MNAPALARGDLAGGLDIDRHVDRHRSGMKQVQRPEVDAWRRQDRRGRVPGHKSVRDCRQWNWRFRGHSGLRPLKYSVAYFQHFVDDSFNVGARGAMVHDTGPQSESSMNGGVGDIDPASALHALEYLQIEFVKLSSLNPDVMRARNGSKRR